MTESDESGEYKGSPRRFDVELFIIHPTLDPAAISAGLGMEAAISHRVSERRRARNGTLLKGTYPDTRWRYSQRYEVTGQWFASKVAELLNRIEPHREFLRNIRATGGSARVMVQFLGDGYFGDSLPLDTLARLVDLELNLDIEAFIVPQRPW